jgi:hypothetical protein
MRSFSAVITSTGTTNAVVSAHAAKSFIGEHATRSTVKGHSIQLAVLPVVKGHLILVGSFASGQGQFNPSWRFCQGSKGHLIQFAILPAVKVKAATSTNASARIIFPLGSAPFLGQPCFHT